jgi:uncharacterized protein YqiB (DUF1249 family)
MIADSYIVPECVIGPGSIGGLMALYESNFIKLDLLVGVNDESTREPGNCRLSHSPLDCDLYLNVEASTRYTRILRMTYLFDEDGHPVADPDLIIRVYLDARMAEVIGWADHHRHALLKGLAVRFRREIDRRWSNNMMLSKWLDYLLESQHSFANAQRVAAPPAAVAVMTAPDLA